MITFDYYAQTVTIYNDTTVGAFYWTYLRWNKDKEDFITIMGAFFSDIEECIQNAKKHVYNEANK
jgi:hypothetical protein